MIAPITSGHSILYVPQGEQKKITHVFGGKLRHISIDTHKRLRKISE